MFSSRWPWIHQETDNIINLLCNWWSVSVLTSTGHSPLAEELSVSGVWVNLQKITHTADIYIDQIDHLSTPHLIYLTYVCAGYSSMIAYRTSYIDEWITRTQRHILRYIHVIYALDLYNKLKCSKLPALFIAIYDCMQSWHLCKLMLHTYICWYRVYSYVVLLI